ncbi:hypothetical protein B0919_04005 [Hymenobacter sp. CRA2]|nr:hypothetical protein B0919_04005 [Hymenobacter sp. CRA2]
MFVIFLAGEDNQVERKEGQQAHTGSKSSGQTQNAVDCGAGMLRKYLVEGAAQQSITFVLAVRQ